MKITYLELENFEAVKHCMNTSNLRIDFSKSENKICLFIGPNGSGKTTILSLLNPFATLGNLDVRDSYNLIIPHKNGKKIIHIEHGNDHYEILHFYTAAKESHTTKSFLSKNGLELNPNGNVSSFKELIKEELGIELDYLKLIRLGPNVKSLISLSSTERKAFMGKLLDDIGIYLTYFKHVNNNMRTLKDMLAHVVDKLKRTRYDEKRIYKEELEKLEEDIRAIETELDSKKLTLGINIGKRDALGDIYKTTDELEKKSKELKKMLRVRNKLGESPKPASYYKEMYEKALRTLSEKESMRSATKMLVNRELDNRNRLEERVHRLSIQLQRESEVEQEINRLKDLLCSCKETIKERKEILDGFESEIALDKFEEFLVFLKSSELTLRKLTDFGQSPMRKIVELLRQNKNVFRFVNNGILESGDDADENQILNRLKRISGMPICAKSDCVGYKTVQMVRALVEDREDEETYDIGFYHDVELLYQGLQPILDGFKPFANLIDQLPPGLKKQFTTDNILTRLEKSESLYDISRMDQFYAKLKDFHELEHLYSHRDQLKEEIKRMERFHKDDVMEDEYQETLKELEASKELICQYKEDIHKLDSEIQELQYTAESMKDFFDTCDRFEDVQVDVRVLQERCDTYHDINSECRLLNNEIERLESQLKSRRNEFGQLSADYASFKELRKNLKQYEAHYDNMDYIKRSLSSSKDGIPTVIIKHYLKDTVGITNELLDVAFDGDVQIGNFNITADSFTIPTYVHDKMLPDVKLASQGETALITVALAFALVNQSLHGYNILALDEIDGPLDQSNRRKFIDILEDQIERIGAEQIFMITHNDMFSTYPIDVVDLSGEENRETYKLANFITIEKE